jgi:chromosome segregation ATPase
MGAALDWACDEFGQKNIVGFSVHLDEYSPQVQVMFTPVTDDGRLAQKHFFKGPADLRRQHKELREHMDAAGYDVEFRVTERSREHLSSSEFQARADRLRDDIADVEEDKATYEGLLLGLANRKLDLERREADVVVTELEVTAARARAAQVTHAALALEVSTKAAQIAAQRLWKESERERDSLREMNSRLEQIPSDVERWLDKARFNGRPVREYFNEASAKAHASRAEVHRLIGGNIPLKRIGELGPEIRG